jgi:hypothetical protein
LAGSSTIWRLAGNGDLGNAETFRQLIGSSLRGVIHFRRGSGENIMRELKISSTIFLLMVTTTEDR